MTMRRAFFVLLVAALAGAGCSRRETNPYVGTWVLKYHGRNLLSLSFEKRGDVLQGTWTRPRTFNYDQDGDFTAISSDHRTEPLKEIVQDGSGVRFVVGSGKDADQFVMRLVDPAHAEVRYADEVTAPPWRLVRAATTRDALLAVDWPEPPTSPDIVALRGELTRMAQEDQAPRQLGASFSPAKVDAVDRAHRVEILRIFEMYGWPKTSMFGKQAAHDFWLLVQHQPLDVQEKMLPAMERAAAEGEASKSSYAMLYDRVMANEGKLQRWGMQTNCMNGKAVLAPVEDPEHLEARRRELNFPPVAEYLKQIDPFCRITSAQRSSSRPRR